MKKFCHSAPPVGQNSQKLINSSVKLNYSIPDTGSIDSVSSDSQSINLSDIHEDETQVANVGEIKEYCEEGNSKEDIRNYGNVSHPVCGFISKG